MPKGLSITYRQSPSGPRRATSVAVPSTCTCSPSGGLRHNGFPSRTVYRLTPVGELLRPLLTELYRTGALSAVN